MKIQQLLLTAFVLSTFTLATADDKKEAAPAETKKAERFFEMRTYHCNEGKLDALNARFRDHTNNLFVKHGMDLIGYWVPTDRKDVLVYILGYPDKESREKSWKAFMADPEWKKVFAASREAAGGPLVKKVDSEFLTPTDYSPIK
ncbi:MAG: NIPSNAP family protein [Verrucomicrobiota bacterium]